MGLENLFEAEMNAVLSQNALLDFAKQHLRHLEALRHATGGDFNIFRILGIRHYEVQTHSPILAELLNPAGAHAQGAVFLELFLKRLGITNFQPASASVQREFFCRKGSLSYGRRIDIWLEDTNRRRIFIENKIYAKDQPSQVRSYHDHDQQAAILYLTLFGDIPSNLPESELAESKCRCISYHTDVLQWLEDCRREAASLPVIRETLTQYIHLIRELTQQSSTRKMNEELIEEIIRDEASFEAFLAIANARTAIEGKLIDNLLYELERIAKEMGLTFNVNRPLSAQHGGFSFHFPLLEQNDLKLRFQFEEREYKRMFYGFCRLQENKVIADSERLFDLFQLSETDAHKDPRFWAAGTYLRGEVGEWRSDSFKVIRSGRFTEEVQTRLQALLQIAEEVFSSKTEEAVLKSDMVS